MRIIKCLADKIEEELEDAEEYIELAIKWKGEEQKAAELFYELSMEEMNHMDRLHRTATERIAKHRAEKGEPPAEMMAVWNYVHEKDMKKAAEIRVKQTMYSKA